MPLFVSGYAAAEIAGHAIHVRGGLLDGHAGLEAADAVNAETRAARFGSSGLLHWPIGT